MLRCLIWRSRGYHRILTFSDRIWAVATPCKPFLKNQFEPKNLLVTIDLSFYARLTLKSASSLSFFAISLICRSMSLRVSMYRGYDLASRCWRAYPSSGSFQADPAMSLSKHSILSGKRIPLRSVLHVLRQMSSPFLKWGTAFLKGSRNVGAFGPWILRHRISQVERPTVGWRSAQFRRPQCRKSSIGAFLFYFFGFKKVFFCIKL